MGATPSPPLPLHSALRRGAARRGKKGRNRMKKKGQPPLRFSDDGNQQLTCSRNKKKEDIGDLAPVAVAVA